jgi:hypothetical protein
MSKWNDYKPEEGSRLGAGDYRCVVVDVEEATSKTSGLPMIVITVQPNGSSAKVKQYIVKNEYFNRNMTSFFDSFGIERGDFNMLGWVGAVGAAKFAEDENGYLKVRWFLTPKQAEALPEWKGDMPERQTVTDIGVFAEAEDDGELPF